jgi:hypothetical protein
MPGLASFINWPKRSRSDAAGASAWLRLTGLK